MRRERVVSRSVARTFGLGLGLALGLGLSSSTVQASAPPEQVAAPPAVALDPRIEVVFEESFSNAETTRGWIHERAIKTLDGLEPEIEAGDSIRILVQGGAFDYRISLELLRKGEALAAEQQPSLLECACGSDEMLEKLAGAIEAGGRTLGELAKRERDETAAKLEKEAQRQRQKELWDREKERPVPPEPPTGYRASKLGHTGIGMLATGGAAMVSGIIMAVQPPQSMSALQVAKRDWSVPGVTVIGIGAAAITAGLTMLIVDVVRCRRDRARCGTPKAAWVNERARWVTRRAGGV